MRAAAPFAQLIIGITLALTSLPEDAKAVSDEEKAALSENATEFGENFVLSLGGKLYDNIWVTTDTKPPSGTNPAYPESLPQIGTDTWRCVACHGWDYKGSDGELGRHKAGKAFPNLTGLAGTDPAIIAKKMAEAPHKLPDDVAIDLVVEVLSLFISLGQYERNSFFGGDGKADGDVVKGRDIYEGACMNCHRPDGKARLVGEFGDKSSLGWIARNRPEQALHKILNGVPGADMLAVRFLTGNQIGNLLAYLQTLDPNEE